MRGGEPDWLEELRRQSRRRRDPWVVLEGVAAVEGALTHWWDIQGVLAASACGWEPPKWSGLEVLRRERAELEDIAGQALCSDVLGLAKIPEETADVAGLVAELAAGATVVVCPRLTDPGEVGAIVRNAAALGAAATIFGDAGVSPFERESLRASGGALFRVPLRFADAGQILRCLRAAGFGILGIDREVEETRELDGLEPGGGPLALVVGSELEGLGSFWRAACDELVRIPAAAGTGAADGAAAAAVCLWELRDRHAAEEDV